MNAKLSNFFELSNILSVKSSLRINLMALFTRFGLGHLLCKLSLEKEAGIPAVQLILSLCLFRIASESIHSIYKKSYYDLLGTGKNCYYRMMTRVLACRLHKQGWKTLNIVKFHQNIVKLVGTKLKKSIFPPPFHHFSLFL